MLAFNFSRLSDAGPVMIAVAMTGRVKKKGEKFETETFQPPS